MDCGRIYKKRTNNNPAADSDDDASERDDFCGSYRILRDLLVPLDIGTLSREYINTTSNDGTTLPIEQFTLLLRREPDVANDDKERRPRCTAK